MTASLLYASYCKLGESPLWHPERNSCFWVDIEGCKLFEYNWTTADVTTREFSQRISLAVQGEENNLVVGLQGGIAGYDLTTGKLSWLTDLGRDWAHHRCNDGACDSQGRLWIGTMDMQDQDGTGSVYRVDKQPAFQKVIGKVSIANGIAWSPDGTRLYFTDSLTGEVWSYHYNGDITFEKAAIRIPRSMGLPDGMAMDVEGMLWIALWGGFGVGRFNPLTGEMLNFIEVSAPHVSSCAFAGEERDQLVITTARHELDETTLRQYPQSGHVFVARPGVKGLPVHTCSL